MTIRIAASEGDGSGGYRRDQLGDTPTRYGPVSRAFHWILAYLLLWQSLMVSGWRVLSEDVMREAARFGPSHTAVGVMVLLLVLPRAIWALVNRRRRPPAEAGLPGRLAHAVHAMLYALMFAIPALGLVRAYAEGKGFVLWGLHLVPATGRKIGSVIAIADLLHGPLGWTLAILVTGHIAMALIHHFILRDRTISRMLGRPRD